MEIGSETSLSVPSAIDQVRVRVLPDGRMTREDAAKYLGTTPKTMAMWQLHGEGPRSVLIGGRRFYFRADLDAYIAAAPTAARPGGRPKGKTAAD